VFIVLAANDSTDSKAVLASSDAPALAGVDSLGTTTSARRAVRTKTTTASDNVKAFCLISVTVPRSIKDVYI
jgi:hypothetical protein